ncbi:hypothetical protein JP75_02395 [Devosia riboflavina]|uniref:VTT domain-containing protein n=1 Tax=Devosia riboflavina TaxID=46914 RepID=A0A087M6C3_9HYPH|nr:DedA family protein [Devosia riboflavina]KFL32426.1 hypothetical protein JP75_02395 [Devosia riboflavina]
MDLLREASNSVAPYIHSYGLLALFALIYLESLGLPLPGETALLGAVALAYEGQLPILGIFGVVVVAAVLGDNTGYLIGRYGGRKLIARFGKLVGLNEDRQAWIEGLYARRGPIIVIGARFIVILRQLNGVVAGSMNMAWPVFFLANVTGAILWTGAWSFGPYVLGHLAGSWFR